MRLGEKCAMVETRIQPYHEQAAKKDRPAAQRHWYRHIGALGLLIAWSSICVWWLSHTNPQWILRTGCFRS
jgi:hypothetical protein